MQSQAHPEGPSAKDLALSIYEIFHTQDSDESVQSSLIDFIGIESLQFVELLLKHKEDFYDVRILFYFFCFSLFFLFFIFLFIYK